ncbi:MAG: hypothetical protein IJL19_01985 [Clostridiales bacterium]|nr:hypothetical protein [Clostridiales bacterium]
MAAFQPLLIQDIGDNENPFGYAGTDANGNLIADPLDNGISNCVRACGIAIYRKTVNDKEFRQTLRASDIDIDCYITDSRIIVRCDKYDKGGTWTGGLTALALNAVERAAANRRTRGKTFLGHIRYEWVSAVAYMSKDKAGLFSSAIRELRILLVNTDKTKYLYVISFKENTDTIRLANDILHKLVDYRARMKDEKTPEEDAFYKKYATARIPHDSNPNNVSSVSIPQYYFAPSGQKFRPEA